jgi:hypothetical protein
VATLPSFSKLWDQYPDYLHYSSGEVKQMIGGKVNAAWITNTCAIRLSRALNYNALEIPRKSAGLNVVGGADKKWYAFRVRELRTWLTSKLGRPGFDISKKVKTPFDKGTISHLRGIIGFDIRFRDATGHLDLWDGSRFSSEHLMSKDYWTHATRIWLWTSAGVVAPR